MDQSQLTAIQGIVMTSASLTFIGSSLMFRSLWKKHPWFRKARVDEKILGAMATASFIRSIAQFQNRFFIDAGALCSFIAFSSQWMGISEMMLNVFLSFNFWHVIVRRGMEVDKSAFYVYLSIALGLPLIGAIVGLSLNAYGNAVTACWIIKARSDLRNILYIGPLWTCLLLSIILNTMAVLKVYLVEIKITGDGFKGTKHLTRIASKSFVYCSMFVVVWVFPTAYRLYEAAYGNSPFWLIATHSFCNSSTGFLTSIGYFMLQRMKDMKGNSQRQTDNQRVQVSMTVESEAGHDTNSDMPRSIRRNGSI